MPSADSGSAALTGPAAPYRPSTSRKPCRQEAYCRPSGTRPGAAPHRWLASTRSAPAAQAARVSARASLPEVVSAMLRGATSSTRSGIRPAARRAAWASSAGSGKASTRRGSASRITWPCASWNAQTPRGRTAPLACTASSMSSG